MVAEGDRVSRITSPGAALFAAQDEYSMGEIDRQEGDIELRHRRPDDAIGHRIRHQWRACAGD